MEHLLAIALGPVQEFIATARRTRDLYAGSRLLAEAAARQLSPGPAALVRCYASPVFPSICELQP